MAPNTAADSNIIPSARNGLIASLCEGLSGEARDVFVGLNWTFVEGPNGIGLNHTPARGTAGCVDLPEPGSYCGRSLSDLAKLVQSENPFERAIGFAAINAHHNRFDCAGSAMNGLDLVEDRGERTVIIGRFPRLEERLPGAAVIEREPGPKDHPEEDATWLLPAAEQVVITASAMGNGSLPALLELARNAFVVLAGPSTPLCPALFDQGINALSGLVAADNAALRRVVLEGGAVRALKRHTRFVTLRNER